MNVNTSCWKKNIVHWQQTPNSDNEYEFGISGLIGQFRAEQITTHPINQQYLSYSFSLQISMSMVKFRSDNQIVYVTISPEETDTKISVDLFNSCGSKYSEDFDIKYVSNKCDWSNWRWR